MKKVVLFSIFLLIGLFFSQSLPQVLGSDYAILSKMFRWLMFICLAFIMINVGREFELDKSRWRSYATDYFIAMATAAVPWILVAVYYMYLLPDDLFTSWDAWKENLLLSRFAAPTSAGILFTMLAAAGLKREWIYQKTQVLAIFDDLDTIILMIPLQILMIGFKWQLFVIIFFVTILLYIGWKKLNHYPFKQNWQYILFSGILLVGFCEGVYAVTKHFMGSEGAIHLEVLLPAFVLGMVMKSKHIHSKIDENVTSAISYVFMFLVGMSTPLFITGEFTQKAGEMMSVTASQPMLGWGELAFHVVMVTVLSNLGKMVPLLFYRDRHPLERLALSIGMFTRGEVGAGIIVIAMGYSLGGPAMIISILSLVLNLILTGGFVIIVKKLSQRVYGAQE